MDADTSAGGPDQGRGPRRVLVVDEDEHVRGLLREALARTPDFELVAEAADGATALEALRTHRPDLVLLDSVLLVVDGHDVLPLVGAHNPAAKVVLLSGGRVSSDSRAEALRLGAHGYLETTGSLTQLVPRLRALLEPGAPGPG